MNTEQEKAAAVEPIVIPIELEYQRINFAVDVFSEWMGKRMLHKSDEGFRGWENPEQQNVPKRLLEKAVAISEGSQNDKDLLDVAIFAMMLFMKRCDSLYPLPTKLKE